MSAGELQLGHQRMLGKIVLGFFFILEYEKKTKNVLFHGSVEDAGSERTCGPIPILMAP